MSPGKSEKREETEGKKQVPKLDKGGVSEARVAMTTQALVAF